MGWLKPQPSPVQRLSVLEQRFTPTPLRQPEVPHNFPHPARVDVIPPHSFQLLDKSAVDDLRGLFDPPRRQ